MTARELALHIASDLGRIGRWALEGQPERVAQFLREAERSLHELELAPRRAEFEPTFQRFRQAFSELERASERDAGWAEDVFTWANILTHRAKLAS